MGRCYPAGVPTRQPLPTRRELLGHLLASARFGALLIAGSLAIGVVGYHWIAGLGWVDAIENAAMILTGMGPVDKMGTDASKLFASGYAIFSGVAFLGTVGVVLAPMARRFLHRFHLELDEEIQDRRERRR